MSHEEGRAYGCGLCGNRVPALTDNGICPGCAQRIAIAPNPTRRRRRRQEKKYATTIHRPSKKR